MAPQAARSGNGVWDSTVYTDKRYLSFPVGKTDTPAFRPHNGMKQRTTGRPGPLGDQDRVSEQLPPLYAAAAGHASSLCPPVRSYVHTHTHTAAAHARFPRLEELLRGLSVETG